VLQVAVHVAAVRVPDQLGTRGAQGARGGQDHGGRDEAAHRDVLALDRLEQPPCVEGEESLERPGVLQASLLGRDVVAHVGGGDEQCGPVAQRASDAFAERDARVDGQRTEAQRGERHPRLAHLQKRQLDLEGVLGEVGSAVLADAGAGAQRRGEVRVDRHAAERGAPPSVGPQRHRRAEASMVGAEDDRLLRNRDARVGRPGHAPGVDVPRVWGEHRHGRCRPGRVGEEGGHLARQLFPARGVEASGDGGFAVHAPWI